MSSRLPIPRAVSFTLCALALLLAPSCKESSSSPTSPAGSATVTGTVIRGGGTSGATAQGMEIGLSGVSVTVTASGQSVTTDSSGNFTLTGVASGEVELQLKRSDFNIKVKITIPAGSTVAITISIVGSSAVVTPRGHAGEEIEGLVQSVNAPSLVVLDNRLGIVMVKTDATTLIRRGDAAIPLSQIQTGMRVHVKAMLQTDGTYLATEVLLQDGSDGDRRVGQRKRQELRRHHGFGPDHCQDRFLHELQEEGDIRELRRRRDGNHRRGGGDTPGRRLDPRPQGDDRVRPGPAGVEDSGGDVDRKVESQHSERLKVTIATRYQGIGTIHSRTAESLPEFR